MSLELDRKKPSALRSTTNALLTKLRLLTALTDDELTLVGEACATVRTFAAGSDIVQEGGSSDHLHVLTDGWACRYKTLADGRRQFPAILIPGDTCDIDGLLVERLDYSVIALTPCRVAILPRKEVRAMIDDHPAIRDVFWWLTFVENAVATEWAVGLGRRSSQERLAHLCCELLVRLTTVALAHDNSYVLPLTQAELADALGLSVVHVNRVLQALRASGLIRLKGDVLTILNWERMKQLSGFKPNYLHLEGLRSRSRVE